jgi:hypothetical protein
MMITMMVQTSDGGFLLGGVSTDLSDGYPIWPILRAN